jgi:K+:H+ antiporter
MNSPLPPTNRLRTIAVYTAMLLATAGIYFYIHAHGQSLVAPPAPGEGAGGTAAAPEHSTLLAHVLLALAAITLLARFMGGIFRRHLHQPPVIGEIVAGLMLGPSLLGAVWPAGYEFLLPAAAAPHLGMIAKVGVVLFMFLVGLDLDPRLLRNNTHTTVAISHASIIAPFLLGALLAVSLYPVYSTSQVSFTAFSLFLGVSLSVTAFPVLARILVDRRVQKTSLGVTALACAAVDDVTAWTLLALVAGIASAQVSGAGWTVALVGVYIAVMFLVARPLLARFAARENEKNGPLSHTALAIVFTTLLLSAVATEAIGIHALFGAFLLGAMLPHEGRLSEQIRARLVDVVLVLFLPSFFVFTGMRTQVGLLSSGSDWLVCGLIILAATLGKFGGSFAAARLTGMGWRRAAALGVLMNTRGLMELIVLNVGLEMRVITPTIFTMMVIMAVVTTFAATPILDRLLGPRGFEDPATEHATGELARAGSRIAEGSGKRG